MSNEDKSSIDDLEISGIDENTTLITSTREMTQKMLQRAMSTYNPDSKINQRNLNSQSMMRTALTEDVLEQLAYRPQESVEKTKEINSYIDYYLNKDDIIGRTYEIIEANTNAQYTLSYPKVEGRNKGKTLDKVKKVIEDFNTSIMIEDLIVDVIPHVYSTGNRVLYLREANGKYLVDKYPIGVAQITSFKSNGEPLVLFSIPDLINRMSGGLSFTKDVNSYVYDSLEKDIEGSYPKEVYAEYLKNKNGYVRLDPNLSGVIRTNNRDKQYGLSPIFKALNPALKLEVQEKSDSMDSKARAKKIIFQKITDKLIGDDASIIDLAPTIHSHTEFISAWANEVVVYTGAPWVEDIKYVEPKTNSDHFNTLTYYRSKVLSALGISFLNGDNKTGVITAEMNFDQLMRVINRISEQLEDVINKWYCVVLANKGLPLEYAPTIKVIDSELMEMNLRIQLTDNLFSKYGASYETVYKMLGIDYNTEIERRTIENEGSVDEKIFYPRMTNHTYSSKGSEDYENDKVDNTDVTKTNKTTKQKTDEVKDNEE